MTTTAPRFAWSLLTLLFLLAIFAAFALLTGSTAEAAGIAGLDGVTPIPAANGGISDGQLAVAIVLPILFGGLLAGTIGWAVLARVKPGDEPSQPMSWWRTGAWYGRRGADEE